MADFTVRAITLLGATLFAVTLPPEGRPVSVGAHDQWAFSAPDTIPSDAFADPGAQELLTRGREAYDSSLEGLLSWEATVREMIAIGLFASGIRRERLVTRSERAARIRWDAPRRETLRWLDRRFWSLVSEAGDDESGEPDSTVIYFPIDPSIDRLGLAAGYWVHPLSADAENYYRYASGDTMSIVLPDLGREVVLVEIRFSPRWAAFELLGGSLWFEFETAALVRGAFRPSLAWDLTIEEPEEWDDMPGFLKPLVIETDLMVVDYRLYDLRWWLPHRVRIEGTGRMGTILDLPFVAEVLASEVTVNEPGLDPDFPPPPGWRRQIVNRCEEVRSAYAEQRERRRALRVPPVAGEPSDPIEVLCADTVRAERAVIDPPREVREAWRDSEEGQRLARQPEAFEAEELRHLRRSVDRARLPPPPPAPARLRLASFRYNRVEGLSGGLRAELPLSSRALFQAEARIGTADLVPNLEVALVRPTWSGQLRAAAYWRLTAANDWGNALDLRSSAHAFLLGYDDGQYYRAGGASVAWRRGRQLRTEVRLFAEAQRRAPKNTDVSVPYWISGEGYPPNVEADSVELVGLAGRTRWQVGRDPEHAVGAATVWGEASVGTVQYARFAVAGSTAIPLRPLALGLELSVGSTAGEVPAQREYFLGGVETLRAFPNGALAGTSFWLGRLELGTARPSIRLVGFFDLGWAGPRSEFALDDPALSLGAGLSALDGLLRLDVARSIRGRDPAAWRVYLSFDGVL